MTTAQALIVEAMRAGVLLSVEGDNLRFKAVRPVPSHLTERIRRHKAAVLAVLDPQLERFARNDADAGEELPVYTSADEPLPPQDTARGAGMVAMILAYAIRYRVGDWLSLAGENEPDRDVLEAVQADLKAALNLLPHDAAPHI